MKNSSGRGDLSVDNSGVPQGIPGVPGKAKRELGELWLWSGLNLCVIYYFRNPSPLFIYPIRILVCLLKNFKDRGVEPQVWNLLIGKG